MSKKVKLKFDWQRAETITRKLTEFCEKANTAVIPLLQSLGVGVTFESVIKYAGNSDNLNADYIEIEKTKSQVSNAYLLQIVERNATDQFNEAFNSYPYDDFTTSTPELLLLEGGALCINKEAVKEFCTIYLQEDQREAYNRYLRAIEALNDFYRGKAPDGVFIGNQFPAKDGKVFPSEHINFNYYK